MTTITGKVYTDRGFLRGGAPVTAWLAPKLTEYQYACAVLPPQDGQRALVVFCAVRGTGNMEWLTFCDAGTSYDTVAEAEAAAASRAAACLYGVRAA